MLKRLAIAVCPSLPYYRAAVEAGRWRDLTADARAVGWPAAVRLWLGQWDKAAAKDARTRVRLRGYRHPLAVRRGGSDPLVVRQVFVHREYAPLLDLSGVEFIVDCGANVGCTTFFLLSHYPTARAVVVEPDPANMAVCRANLAPFAGRVTFLQAGVWSAAGPLVVERGTYRDGEAWSVQVRPARPNEPPDVTALTIPDVFAAAGFPRADILKIDIEGAETEVFAAARSWLPMVRHLAVETHGPECERAVAAAVAGFRFRGATAGETSFYHDLTPAP